MAQNNSTDKLDPLYLEIWKAALEAWDKEADRFWTRNNVFLMLCTALIAILIAVNLEVIIRLAVSVLAMLFSYIWLKVNRRGKYYLDRWKKVIIPIEKKFLGISILSGFPPPSGGKPTTIYMQYITLVFWATFIVIFINTLISLVSVGGGIN